MTQRAVNKAEAERTAPRTWPLILAAVVPAALLALYYITLDRKEIMDWVIANIAAPYRNGAAHVTSFGPLKYFSLAEVLITALVLWVLYFIVKTIIVIISHPHKLYVLTRRLLILIVVALYLFTAYSWLWGSGYNGTNLAEKTGLGAGGVTVQQLTNAARHFAENANALSGEVKRDADGHFDEKREYYLEMSKGVYANISKQYPQLAGDAFAPKAMLYSKLMSAVGFTGIYIALTGEANVNVDAPSCLVPATIAHEMAHQLGVNQEEEANFAGIAACITSNITVYEYSGYLQGLLYLLDALNKADPEACAQIMATLSPNVLADWRDNNEYWEKHETPAAATVTAIYDGYLKSNGQELGIASYGACVDMLADWVKDAA